MNLLKIIGNMVHRYDGRKATGQIAEIEPEMPLHDKLAAIEDFRLKGHPPAPPPPVAAFDRIARELAA